MNNCHHVNDTLARMLSGSRLVEYDEQTGLVYDWNGAHTVSVYNTDGEFLDVFTFGDFALDNETLEKAEAAIQNQMALDRGEVDDE